MASSVEIGLVSFREQKALPAYEEVCFLWHLFVTNENFALFIDIFEKFLKLFAVLFITTFDPVDPLQQ